MHSGRPLQGKAALITGASSGLGRAVAVEVARAGADVAVMARNEDALDELADELRALGIRALICAADLSDVAAIQRLAKDAIDELGGVHLLVNSAATDTPGSIEHFSVQEWDRVIAVNLRAPFILSKIAFPHMREAGGGTIVNISSVAGRRGWANAGAYCSSKFALTGLTQVLNAEGKTHGIRTCVIYPGAMATSWGSWDPESRGPSLQASKPATVALRPERIASLIVWFATAPHDLVLNEITATPLHESGWP